MGHSWHGQSDAVASAAGALHRGVLSRVKLMDQGLRGRTRETHSRELFVGRRRWRWLSNEQEERLPESADRSSIERRESGEPILVEAGYHPRVVPTGERGRSPACGVPECADSSEVEMPGEWRSARPPTVLPLELVDDEADVARPRLHSVVLVGHRGLLG